MFPRKHNKQNKIKRLILKLLNVYAYNKETLNIENPNYNNQKANFIKFNDKSFSPTRGYLELTRKIKKLDIFFRYAPSVNLWNSTKRWKRIIPDINKETLISVCLNSLKISILSFLEKNNLDICLHLVSDNSYSEFDNNILKLLENQKFKVKKHSAKIQGNHGSYLECCDIAEFSDDIIFFIEDDYLFEKNCIEEMLFTYSRISSIIDNDIILCPTDYPFFYDSLYNTNIFIGKDYKWRLVGETLLTFMFSKNIFNTHKKNIRLVGEKKNEPFEKPLHEIYKVLKCLAPVNSLSYHISRSVPDDAYSWINLWNKNFTEYKKYKFNQR